MQDALYSNQNLAGILREAMGLEAMSGGRSDFSCTSRETLRQALASDQQPTTFAELEQALIAMGIEGETLESIRKRQKGGIQNLQEFAAEFARTGRVD